MNFELGYRYLRNIHQTYLRFGSEERVNPAPVASNQVGYA